MSEQNNQNPLETPDLTGQFDQNDIEQNKVMAAIGYIGILVLVPLFGAKDSKFARFHANQSLVMIIAFIAYAIVSSVLSFILGGIPLVGRLIVWLLRLVYLALVALVILGIVNAATGKAKALPIIGGINILK